MSFGFFGAKPATGTPGFGAAPATGGSFGSAAPAVSSTGFGAKPATTTSGGFGATGLGAAAPAVGAGGGGGFGSSTGGGGFGAAGGGFGAKPMTVAPTFGATSGTGGFGTSASTGGLSMGGGGFSLSGGFGGLGSSATSATVNAAPTAAQYPYPGIKGPGNAMSWAREVDFSQVTEQTPFENLPQPLQQHLMELRSFMHAEREATKKIYEYLNESDKTISAKGGAGEAATVSYRSLLSRLAALKGCGNRAVDIVAVQCNQHEGQVRRQLQRTEKLEASVRDYERHVWEPLIEQGLPLSASNGAFGPRGGGAYRPAVNSDATSPFVSLVEELSRRLDGVSEELAALESTLVSPGRPLRGVGANDRASPRGGSAIPSDTIAQINASLMYELNQLRDFSCVAAHLHSLTETARELFTRQYGQAEADVLFTDTEAQRNGMALFRRASAATHFDIPPLPQQQQLPRAAPAGGGITAPTTTTVGGFAVKPATTTTTTTGGGFGFGTTTPAATSTAAPGGAAAASTTTTTTTPMGFGASAAPVAGTPSTAPATTSSFGVPPTAGAAPAAPTMGPASPAGAPSSFSLGGAATGAASFGLGPGKSAADGDDRPSRRAR